MILPRKSSFHGGVHRDALFAKKVVLCNRCKTQYMIGKNFPVATPNTEDSCTSVIEQSDTPRENLAPVQPESSVVIQPSAETQQTSSPSVEEAGEEDSSKETISSTEETDSGSDS